ncbi:hypothetical protein EJ05DRAFT_475871 [Pseudovirgaria hyperparasitica]|uniref:Uncharacterized protein n=1 Tax=Pseudovirgaria hyperparasitica TaxID=470096 RepID=A0A6A6W9L6_9PEZI|nr:uncharacterized protein EJ05DRAFT_475871 [Pseudovirgaria hyperparasitica]KAF2758566.1 hypothetical protein EJ05DRAFT_475871 [Pseudovirgaria hyperparasitica]
MGVDRRCVRAGDDAMRGERWKVRCDAMRCDAMRCDAMRCDAIVLVVAIVDCECVIDVQTIKSVEVARLDGGQLVRAMDGVFEKLE